MENQEIDDHELEQIRKLEDFDLIMLISEIHEMGWLIARETLCLMPGGKGQEEYLRLKKKNHILWEALALGKIVR